MRLADVRACGVGTSNNKALESKNIAIHVTQLLYYNREFTATYLDVLAADYLLSQMRRSAAEGW